MQRKKVDLPAPEAPMMQTTLPGATSRSMPFSTSTSPYRLWTLCATTIGSTRCLLARGRGAWPAKAEQALPQRVAEGGGRRGPRIAVAAANAPLDEALHGGQDRGQQDVPQRGHDQQRDGLEGARVDQLGRGE